MGWIILVILILCANFVAYRLGKFAGADEVIDFLDAYLDDEAGEDL